MVRVLLVDDDIDVLHVSKKALLRRRDDWEIQAVDSARAGLERLQNGPIDVVISDYQMPEMDGVELLRAVADNYPMTVRFLRSGAEGIESEIRSVSSAHRFFKKTGEFDEVILEVERAVGLRRRFNCPMLQALLNRIRHLPSPPKQFFAIRTMLSHEDFYVGKLVDLLASDISLSALLLRAANSAYYGMRDPVQSVERAVTVLGVNTIRSFVLAAELFSQLEPWKVRRFKVDQLWDHSMKVASLASSFAASRRETEHLRDAAQSAGLFHDIGKLALIHSLPEEYYEVMKVAEAEELPLYLAEEDELGVSHQELGAYLLALWGIDDSIVEAAAYHHDPSLSPYRDVSVLTFAAAANVISSKMSDVEHPDEEELCEYLAQVGVIGSFHRWLEMAEQQSGQKMMYS